MAGRIPRRSGTTTYQLSVLFTTAAQGGRGMYLAARRPLTATRPGNRRR